MARSTLSVLPTGTGKTVIFGHVARDWREKRVMIAVHRDELCQQAEAKVGAICSETCGVEMAESEVNEQSMFAKPRVVVASVQSLNSQRGGRYRMEKFNPNEFGLLIIDEAHHSTAPTYRRMIDWFYRNPNLKLLGVTATPDRTDEEALGQIFETVAFEYQILDAIGDGWLVPIEQQFVHVEGLDLSGCKSNKNDLQDIDVARVMQQEGLLHKVVDPIVQLAGDSPTLVFAASVEHAHRMAEIFNRHKPSSAIAIDGGTDKEVRREHLRQFSRGEFQYLVNMGVFLEGFDEPRIGCVAMARPTKSRSLYAQCAGRGTRPLPGLVDGVDDAEMRKQLIANSGKPSMLMLDFVGNSGRHKLVCTADILGGNESDAVIDRATATAKRKSAQGQKVDMQKELALAKEDLEEEIRQQHERERQAAARRSHITPKAKFNTKSVNPFDIFDIVPKREPGWHKGRKATPGQKELLSRFKVDDDTIAGLSFCQAGEMISLCIKRRQQGLCTVKQAKLIQRYGYHPDTKFDEANRIITALKANRWQPLKEPGA